MPYCFCCNNCGAEYYSSSSLEYAINFYCYSCGHLLGEKKKAIVFESQTVEKNVAEFIKRRET